MTTLAAITLFLLFLKHWYVDFVDQTMDEVHSKAHYGQWLGIRHSLKHGVATLIVLGMCGIGFNLALVLAVADFVIHYHTDWAKMNYGNRDITNPRFWTHLGLDQLVHSVTYILIVLFSVVG
jgi:hypothetical protein